MIKKIIRTLTDEAISAYGFESERDSKVLYNVESPSNLKFGDFSTNVAMVYAKSEKKSPMDIAEKLVDCYQVNKNIIKKPNTSKSTLKSKKNKL